MAQKELFYSIYSQLPSFFAKQQVYPLLRKGSITRLGPTFEMMQHVVVSSFRATARPVRNVTPIAVHHMPPSIRRAGGWRNR